MCVLQCHFCTHIVHMYKTQRHQQSSDYAARFIYKLLKAGIITSAPLGIKCLSGLIVTSNILIKWSRGMFCDLCTECHLYFHRLRPWAVKQIQLYVCVPRLGCSALLSARSSLKLYAMQHQKQAANCNVTLSTSL